MDCPRMQPSPFPGNKTQSVLHHSRTLFQISSPFWSSLFSSLRNNSHQYTNLFFCITHTQNLFTWCPLQVPCHISLLLYRKKKRWKFYLYSSLVFLVPFPFDPLQLGFQTWLSPDNNPLIVANDFIGNGNFSVFFFDLAAAFIRVYHSLILKTLCHFTSRLLHSLRLPPIFLTVFSYYLLLVFPIFNLKTLCCPRAQSSFLFF